MCICEHEILEHDGVALLHFFLAGETSYFFNHFLVIFICILKWLFIKIIFFIVKFFFFVNLLNGYHRSYFQVFDYLQ